jgi:hypothetical protein
VVGPSGVEALVSGLGVTDRPPDEPPGARAVVIGAGAAAGSDDPAEASLLAWGPRGRAALEEGVSAWVERSRLGGFEVWVWPRADGLVSDAPTVLGLVRKHAGSGLRVFLEPEGLLSASMLARAEDHLRRACEALVPHEATAAVLVSHVGDGAAARGPIGPGLVAMVESAALAAGKPVTRASAGRV